MAAKLTVRQQKFVEAYLVCGNAAEAYRRAGYKAKTAKVAAANAARLIASDSISAAISEGRAKASDAAGVEAADVLRELAAVAFSDVGAVLDFTGTDPKLRPAVEIPEAARRSIASVKVRRYVEGRGDEAREVEVTEFRLWPKNDALEKLGKHLGMWAEKKPLEELLAGLDPRAAELISRALAAAVSAGAGAPGGGPGPPAAGEVPA